MAACWNVEHGRDRDVDPETLFFDYRIWAEEGEDNIICMFQYKAGGPDGTALVLDEGSSVQLDGKLLHVDSAKFTGAYYELEKPLTGFTGRHIIVFTGSNGKQYKEEFEFRPFHLFTELPEEVKHRPFVIKLRDFPVRETPVHLVITDTAFASDDINEIIPIVKGEVVIDAYMLSKIKKGPVTLEVYREEERQLKQRTRAGGKILIKYGLKRDFELID